MWVDAKFPGGNIVVERIDGDTVRIFQDLRNTANWWFYWFFRVTGAAGRTLTFEFTNRNVFGEAGPSYSEDGVHWRWLGAEVCKGHWKDPVASFTWRIPDKADTCYFAFSIPYVQSNLERFLGAHKDPRLVVSELCRSERGRTVEKLLVRDWAASPAKKLLLTCRHHACESVAGYVLEGLIDGALGESAELLKAVEIHAVPFVDKDGVEDGEQGKFRDPFDHNRDYTDRPRYAATRAIREMIGPWGDDLAAAIDLHCPWMWGGLNSELSFVEPENADLDALGRFYAALERTQTGPLRFSPRNNMPFGVGWNKGESATFTRYVRTHFRAPLAFSLEFPYAKAGGELVTADGAREFGRSMARALRDCLLPAS